MNINWLAFIGVLIAAYVIPGPDFAVIIRSATKGARAGYAAATGAQLGLCVHMTLAVIGLSAVLVRHPSVLTIIRLIGGAYLLFLGGRLIVATLRRSKPQLPVAQEATVGSAFRQGLITNLTNPKAILFFAAVLPQFVVHSSYPIPEQVATLGLFDVAFGFVIWAVVIALGVRISAVLQRPSTRRWWDRVTGGILGALGLFVIVRG